MKNNIKELTKYLITKGIDSPLKLQKILFFLRVEEKKNNETENSFFNENNNFQAWIYGPVNLESFKFAQEYFDQENEKEAFLLMEKKKIKEIDKKYLKYLKKYIDFTPIQLMRKSHKNLSWIKARGNLGSDEICKNFLEEDENFIKFK